MVLLVNWSVFFIIGFSFFPRTGKTKNQNTERKNTTKEIINYYNSLRAIEMQRILIWMWITCSQSGTYSYLTNMNLDNAREAAVCTCRSEYLAGLLHTVTMREPSRDNRLLPPGVECETWIIRNYGQIISKTKVSKNSEGLENSQKGLSVIPVTISWSQIFLIYSASASSAVAPVNPISSSSVSLAPS